MVLYPEKPVITIERGEDHPYQVQLIVTVYPSEYASNIRTAILRERDKIRHKYLDDCEAIRKTFEEEYADEMAEYEFEELQARWEDPDW